MTTQKNRGKLEAAHFKRAATSVSPRSRFFQFL